MDPFVKAEFYVETYGNEPCNHTSAGLSQDYQQVNKLPLPTNLGHV